MRKYYFVHSTSVIDEKVKIGSGSKIWHWCHLSKGSKIGKNCTIGQNVFIGENVKIGNNVKIQNNVSIFDKVVLEDDVFCGPSMVFTNVYNPRAQISRKNEYKQTIVKKGVTIGANATIICGITLGSFSFIAAGSVVRTNVKPYALIAGVPGQQIGWMSEYGEQLPISLNGEGEVVCKRTGELYSLRNGNLRKGGET